MKSIHVGAIAAALMLGGCSMIHTNIKLPGQQSASTAQPARAASNETAASQAQPAQVAQPSKAEPSREEWKQQHYAKLVADVDALIAKLPTEKDPSGLLDELTATYPSDPIVKEYQALHQRHSPVDSSDTSTAAWAAVDAKFNELDQKLNATIALPKDAYSDKDAKKVRAAFTTEAGSWTKKKVLKVVLRYKDWGRKSGSQWQGDTLVNFDNGYMKGYAVVEGAQPELADVWMFDLRRDYLDGGKIKDDTYVPTKIASIKKSILAAR